MKTITHTPRSDNYGLLPLDECLNHGLASEQQAALGKVLEGWGEVAKGLERDLIATEDWVISFGEPVAWQNLTRPDDIVLHEDLDPMWHFMMRPLYAGPDHI